MTFVPLADRLDQPPQSSLEARSLALMWLRDLYGVDPMSAGARDIARDISLAWDTHPGLDIAEAVADLVRCEECRGRGSYPGSFAEDCPNCEGEAVVLP